MKFTAALFIGLVAADRTSFLRRQDATNPIANVFAQLKPMVVQLDGLITSYTGGPGDDVLAQSKKIVQFVKQSVGTVTSTPQLDISAASTLVAPVQDFTKSLQQTISDLISKKQLAVSNGLGGKVYANLQAQDAGAQALSDAIKSKMPQSLAATADELSGDIIKVIQQGLAAFQDQAGSTGGGAGAGAGSAGSAPTTSTSGSAGSAGSAGGSLTPAGSSYSGAGAGAASGMGMGAGSSSGASYGASSGSSGSYAGATSPMTTTAAGSNPAVFTGAGASFKPASVFGLVAVAAAVLVM